MSFAKERRRKRKEDNLNEDSDTPSEQGDNWIDRKVAEVFIKSTTKEIEYASDSDSENKKEAESVVEEEQEESSSYESYETEEDVP